MTNYLGLILFFASIGTLLGLGAHLFWQATGRFMLAIGAIALVAGYAAAMLANAGCTVLLTLFGGAAAGTALGCGIGFAARRLSIEEFLLLALAVSELARRLAFSLASITGGAYGLQVRANWPLPGIEAFLVVGVFVIAALWVVQKWFSVPGGLRWRLVGGARRSAVLNGINPLKVEVMAGALAGLAAGLVGGLHISALRFLHPDDLGLTASLPALAVGIATRPRWLVADGLALGGILFGLREVLRLVGNSTSRFAVFDIVSGCIILGVALRLARHPNVR